jgi:hypothetical protein
LVIISVGILGRLEEHPGVHDLFSSQNNWANKKTNQLCQSCLAQHTAGPSTVKFNCGGFEGSPYVDDVPATLFTNRDLSTDNLLVSAVPRRLEDCSQRHSYCLQLARTLAQRKTSDTHGYGQTSQTPWCGVHGDKWVRVWNKISVSE